MGFLKAVGKGFSLTHRLWFALLFVLVSNAAFGALATVLLPYQVVSPEPIRIPIGPEAGTIPGQGDAEGQGPREVVVQPGGQRVQTPPILSWEDFRKVAPPALLIFFLSSTWALFLLGGILGSLKALLRQEAVSPRSFFQAASHWFFPIVGWATALGLVALGAALGLGIPLSIAVTRTVSPGEVEKGVALVLMLFLFLFSLAVLVFLFSPVSLVERSRGIWASLGDSLRFLLRHLLGTAGLLVGVVVVGVLAQVVGLALGAVANSIRGALGITPYAKGWPVFFFTLMIGIPQAYLVVFFPAVLYAYYHANTKP